MSAYSVIKTSAEFQAISKNSKRWVTPAFILLCAPQEKICAQEKESSIMRVGFTASKKVGNAVMRNRAKRRLREVVRLFAPSYKVSGFDIVLIAKTSARNHDFQKLQNDLVWALKKLEVLK